MTVTATGSVPAGDRLPVGQAVLGGRRIPAGEPVPTREPVAAGAIDSTWPDERPRALLVLADGEVFEGDAIGAMPAGGLATGELVFNTVLSGYQEVLTDPSYAGQVIAFTYPHIGNYGVTADDDEAASPWCRGVVMRDLPPRPSSWRATGSLEDFLVQHGVPGIAGVDTRRLTRHLRNDGAMGCAFGTAGEATLRAAAAAEPGTTGLDLVSAVTTSVPYQRGTGPLRIVAYDFGVKATMLRCLGDLAVVTVVPADMPANQTLALEPDGVFLSNGPGDPAALTIQAGIVADLLGKVPVFGICLGHQLLATAVGGRTYKLPFGHHGGNHPVRRVQDGRVEITSQNHNYAVDGASLRRTGAGPVADVTHVNLNDGVVEGIRLRGTPAFSVQYHPEAGPGPHDARYLFDEFRRLLEAAPVARSQASARRPETSVHDGADPDHRSVNSMDGSAGGAGRPDHTSAHRGPNSPHRSGTG
jgi:carbamoyl-phosphate synthase small subunit